MHRTHALTGLASLALAGGLIAVTTAGASAAPAEEPLAAVPDPLLAQQVDGYTGAWGVDGDVLQESFEKDGVVVSTGTTGLRDDVADDAITSFGYVAGDGVHAQLSGQAGDGVVSVQVISASGITTTAALADGVWGAVWLAGDDADEFGAASLRFTTAEGTKVVSTDSVDVIAAEQRAADQG